MNKKLYWALILLFSLIFLISAIFVGQYVIESYQHHQDMENIRPTQPSRPSVSLLPPTSSVLPGTSGSSIPPTSSLPPVGPTTVPTAPPTLPTAPSTLGSSMLPDMEALYNLNKDVVGYIYIEDTNINYPVLQRASIPNYYLYRDFYGNDDRHGSVYVREACDVFAPSDNVTIYGHNMADGSMFANIHKFKSESFFEKHPLVYFDTLYERHIYQIVCIFRTSGTYGVGFPYHLYDNFKDEAEFDEFIKGVRNLAINDSGISVKYGDKFICLSTCEERPISNGRLVLLAVRIS